MFVGCGSLLVVSCLVLFVRRVFWPLGVVCRLVFVVCRLFVVCLMFVVCRLFFVFLLSLACRLLLSLCSSLFVVGCLLLFVCCWL